jgi:hypothetical protein
VNFSGRAKLAQRLQKIENLEGNHRVNFLRTRLGILLLSLPIISRAGEDHLCDQVYLSCIIRDFHLTPRIHTSNYALEKKSFQHNMIGALTKRLRDWQIKKSEDDGYWRIALTFSIILAQ